MSVHKVDDFGFMTCGVYGFKLKESENIKDVTCKKCIRLEKLKGASCATTK